MSQSFLLLGYGYTAPYLKEALLNKYPDATIYSTSRKGNPHIRFDLDDPETWNNLPKVDCGFWLFPARPLEKVEKFLRQSEGALESLIVVGSTSAFVVKEEGQRVSEVTEVDMSIDRVLGEKEIQQFGGSIVYASGIYGKNRNPQSWVEKGLVGPSDKYVNFIHVEDLAQILLAAYEKGSGSSVYIASNKNPQTWNQIIDHFKADTEFQLPSDFRVSRKLSKKVDASLTLESLNVKLKHPSFTG